MAAAPPPLPDDLVEEVLLRLPPDDPACLLRASLVCKAWGGIVSRPAFRRRLHELHRTPPVLGFLHDWVEERIPQSHFIPTTASSFSLAAPDHRSWRALDCRHGRALFLSKGQDKYARELLVWEPITGTQQRVPVPAAFEGGYSTAAVFCAADGCDHRDCLGGPFRVLLVFSSVEDTDDDEYFTSACVYSSETGAWGEPTSKHGELTEFAEYSSVLVGSSLLYFMFYDYRETALILEYDSSRHALTVLSPPPSLVKASPILRLLVDNQCDCLYNLVLTEDGGLGVIQVLDPHVKLWTREASDGTDARWVLSRVIYLRNLLPTSARLNEGYRVHVLGFAEGANVIFVNTLAGLFAIELQSEQARKVCDHHCGLHNLVPVVTFYTPVPRGDHQNLLVSKPSEKAGGEEGGEHEKTVNQAQQLFDNGSNAIKEGDFVNTFECISNDHNIRLLVYGEEEGPGHCMEMPRVPCYGKVPPDCSSTFDKYECAYKRQEVNDSLDDVPKSAPNEESVKGTSSEGPAGERPLVAVLKMLLHLRRK